MGFAGRLSGSAGLGGRIPDDSRCTGEFAIRTDE
jgi:hypothetical protein